jgi:DNA-binding CsgD family transcriptional regulator
MFLNVTVRTLSDALLQLHRSGTHEDFPSRLFACLKSCLSCDFYSYDEQTENQAQHLEVYPASAVNFDLFSGWIDQRPDIHGIYRHGRPPGVLRFCAPCRRFSSEFHNELLILLGQQHHLSVGLFDQRSRVDVVVSRCTRPFSEEESQMLEMLRPHLAQAYKSSNQTSFSSEAIGVADAGFLVTDRDGKIGYATAKARRLIGKYFLPESEEILPERIQRWLKERERLDSVISLQQLRIDFGRTSLSVRIMPDANPALYRLSIRETAQTVDAELLVELGLTRKEAEVLFWASQGKSNGDIAIILTSKVRTVAKHLERIFAKLMVENRTAAVRAALDRISISESSGARSPESLNRVGAQIRLSSELLGESRARGLPIPGTQTLG